MIDVRPIKPIPLELEGVRFDLRINNNVLADVQAMCGGDLLGTLTAGGTSRSILQFVAAAVNEDADLRGLRDDKGLPVAYTWRQVGRLLTEEQLAAIAPLISRAIIAAVFPGEGEAPEAENPPTTQS